MKLAVIGGTGLIGSQVVKKLNAAGHEAVPYAQSTGTDVLSGQGLDEAVAGADVLVNLTNSPTFDEASLAFFRTSMDNLLAAARKGGVGHFVILSIVGVDQVPELDYYRAKALQEEILAAGPVPYSIVRATQFMEFMDAVLSWTADGDTVRLPATPIQPIASKDVAAAVADVATGAPLGGIRKIAGPEVFSSTTWAVSPWPTRPTTAPSSPTPPPACSPPSRATSSPTWTPTSPPPATPTGSPEPLAPPGPPCGPTASWGAAVPNAHRVTAVQNAHRVCVKTPSFRPKPYAVAGVTANTTTPPVRNASPIPWKGPSGEVMCGPYFASYAAITSSSTAGSATGSALPSTTRSSPSVSEFLPVVSAQCPSPARFLAFCSSAPVEKYSTPSCQAASTGVTCSRPSGRTVDTQKISADSSCRRASAHSVAVTSAAPGRGLSAEL